MASMADQLRKKAKRAYPVPRSTKVVKTIRRSDITALNRSMESITRQNARERLASENAVAGSVFGGRV